LQKALSLDGRGNDLAGLRYPRRALDDLLQILVELHLAVLLPVQRILENATFGRLSTSRGEVTKLRVLELQRRVRLPVEQLIRLEKLV